LIHKTYTMCIFTKNIVLLTGGIASAGSDEDDFEDALDYQEVISITGNKQTPAHRYSVLPTWISNECCNNRKKFIVITRIRMLMTMMVVVIKMMVMMTMTMIVMMMMTTVMIVMMMMVIMTMKMRKTINRKPLRIPYLGFVK